MSGIRPALAAASILALLTLASGCGQNVAVTPPPGSPSPAVASPAASSPSAALETQEASASSAPQPSPSDDSVEKAQEEFRALLDTPGNEKAAFALLSRLAPDLGEGDASWMFFALEDYQRAAVLEGSMAGGDLVGLIQSASDTPYDEAALNDPGTISDAGLKSALQELFDRGYKLVIPEGNYQAVIDYGAYAAIATYLPPDLAAYVEIMARESAQRMLNDGGIIIPLDEVITRALGCEKFMITYGTSQKAEQVSTIYSGYIDAYFFGMDNTPVFDYETKRLSQAFLDSYQRNVSDSFESAFVTALTAYVKILSENGYVLSQEVADARDKLTEPLRLKPCYG